MAKNTSGRRKNQTKKSPKATPVVPDADKVEDAEVVVESPAETEDATSSEPSTETPKAEEPEVTTEVADATKEDQVEEIAVDAEKVEESIPSEPTPPPPVAEPQQKSTFIPLVLGGAVAGIIGYGIGTYQAGNTASELSALLTDQSSEITALKEEVAILAEGPDDSALVEQITGVAADLGDLSNRIDESVTGLDERLTVVERQPSADGTLQETAIAAFEADIIELRDQIAAQQEEMRGLLTQTREEAQAIEDSAIASARAATARASLAVIQGSLESGAPLGAALTDLAGSLTEPVPDALTAAADGVSTLSALQAEFPEAARDALNTARSEGASGEDSGGFGGFLRNQFDVRSVEPQEGDSVDAILSRGEAALKEGRLNDTLAELASLPEVARATLTDWTAKAEQRAAAIDAAASLASQLNVN